MNIYHQRKNYGTKTTRVCQNNRGVSRAIQNSQGSLNKLAKRYTINPKTVAKWKKRSSVQDTLMGPKQALSSVLIPEQEAICTTFHTPDTVLRVKN